MEMKKGEKGEKKVNKLKNEEKVSNAYNENQFIQVLWMLECPGDSATIYLLLLVT